MKKAHAPQALWRIRGYDSTIEIYRRDFKGSDLGEHQVKSLLRALVARAGLDYDEIVGAYAARRAGIANNLLEVTRDGLGLRFSCGTNPHFTAVFVRADEPIGRKPHNIRLHATPPRRSRAASRRA